VTDAPPGVVVLYARFLEYQNRRREIAAPLTARDLPQALDATSGPEAAAPRPPLTGADTS
jgi:hypothetical protein